MRNYNFNASSGWLPWLGAKPRVRLAEFQGVETPREDGRGRTKTRVGVTAHKVSAGSSEAGHGEPAAHGENAGKMNRRGRATSAGTLMRVPAPSVHEMAG